MSTPVLTKRQQRHSLSSKKTPVKGLRNVLAQPQDHYWPIVRKDKCEELEELLTKLTPAMKRPSLAIPWSQLRQMKKEERVEAKKNALLKQEHIPNNNVLNSVVLGINAVTRSLEKCNVCSILLDINVEPTLLIKHIVIMAQNKGIPILLVPFLKSVTLSTIGFASAALALKNSVGKSMDHHFYPLHKHILDNANDIPPPKNSLQFLKHSQIESDVCKDIEMRVETEEKSDSIGSNNFSLSTNVYKYRSSRKERAFVPPSAVETTAEKMDSTDFISISKYEWDDADEKSNADVAKFSRYMNIRPNVDTKTQEKELMSDNSTQMLSNDNGTSVKYLPLKVKRLQGNSNRVKATKVAKQKKK